MMYCLEKRYRKSDAIVSRKIGSEFVMVPIRQDVGDLSSIYVLNEVAARIWELIDGERTAASIIEKIVEEYQITPQEAEADIRDHLELLESNKMILSD
jgi:hypothetical protein